MIERQNVLDLIGNDRNKYHSCIITCYSFDFMFFEQRILPKLRSAGIININVYVDARMYQKQLAHLDGIYLSKQSYSIVPVHLNGAFHPKVLYIIGKNNGFLAIGSGNLTYSGFSSNDEVWGAFHTYKIEGKATPLFGEVYRYLKQLKRFCYGTNLNKWDWLEKNSLWLTEVALSDTNSFTNKDVQIHLLSSFNESSIYKQLLGLLPKKDLQSITIISPYYNSSGALIKSLIEDFTPDRVDIVVDARFGTIPKDFIGYNSVRYHQWHEISSDGNHENARLHAKIIQFKYSNQCWILCGSSNATIEAFGGKAANAKNAEMNLLIKKEKAEDLLSELQIEIPEDGMRSLENVVTAYSETADHEYHSFNHTIKHVEKNINSLSLFIDDHTKLPSAFFVIIEKSDGTLSDYLINNATQEVLLMQISESDAMIGFKLYLADIENNRISNYQKIHDVKLIERTNPDAKSKRIIEILNGTELNNTDLITLLEFASFDKPIVSNHAINRNTPAPSDSNEIDPKKYDDIPEEEFNRNEELIEEHRRSNASNLSMLEEFLNEMVFGQSKQEDVSDSIESSANESGDEGLSGKDDVIKERIKLSYHEGQRLRNKLHITLKNINNALIHQHGELLTNLVKKLPFDLDTGIEDLKSLLLGTHLIFMKYQEDFLEERIRILIEFDTVDNLLVFEKENKSIRLARIKYSKLENNQVEYSADVNTLSDLSRNLSLPKGINLIYHDETPSITLIHKFFKNSPIYNTNGQVLTTIKGYLLNSIAPMLLIFINEKQINNNAQKLEQQSFKNRLLNRILLLCMIVHWDRKEQWSLKLLLLNSLYALISKPLSIEDIIEEIEQLKNSLAISDYEFERNTPLLKEILKTYIQWKHIYDLNKKDLIKPLDRYCVGRTIFKAKYGFTIIETNYSGFLNLKTPLGVFNENTSQYEIKNVKAGSKAIFF